jgi:NADH-quinone oxidoreductase subunit M
VAYGTIQEMNLIYLIFCWGDTFFIISGIIFTATHAFLSALMFFLVDCIYRRYGTRSLIEISGLLHITPNLGISILLMVIFFSGLPGTIKFVCEFYIFSGFFEISITMCSILIIVANVLGLIGFSKCWFNSVFGGFTKYTKHLPMDLTLKEIFIINLNFLLLFLLSYTPNVLF